MKRPSRLIRTAVVLAETRNMKETARRLGISRSWAHRRIRMLEKELGMHLFFRDWSLTPAGKVVVYGDYRPSRVTARGRERQWEL